jgi:hypothetical protein
VLSRLAIKVAEVEGVHLVPLQLRLMDLLLDELRIFIVISLLLADLFLVDLESLQHILGAASAFGSNGMVLKHVAEPGLEVLVHL